jgi:hypothetical protein
MTMTFRMLPPASAFVAGTLVTNAATATSSPTIGAAAVPAWVTHGSSLFDTTSGNPIGTVASATSTTVTLTANASYAVASGDTLSFQPPQVTTVNGRVYSCANGNALDVVDFDAIALVAAGWVKVAISGPTGARPKPAATSAPYIAGAGFHFFDVTINKLIVFDGGTWRDPATGTAV